MYSELYCEKVVDPLVSQKSFFKRIITVVLILTLFLTPAIPANAAASFKARLTEPNSSNEYYFSDKNVFYKYGYGMPNCTAYAYGRAYEILGKTPNLCPHNAGEWYTYNINNGYYSYGKTPKLGAVAVWDNYDSNTGHVAVVEKIEGTTLTLSESAWGGSMFFTSKVQSTDSNLGYSRMRFLGFIYLGDFTANGSINENNPSENNTPGTSVSTNQAGELWSINSSNGVNLRSNAGTNYTYLITLPHKTNIRVLQKVTSNGYTWGKVTYNGYTGWCVLEYANKIGVLGDATGDGIVDIADISEMQKYIAKLKNFSSNQKLLVDITKSGSVDSADVLQVQKYIGKLINNLA